MEIKNYFAQDAQGNIMPSANCYLYLPGTTTLATGLVDGNGFPISNPFLASGMGQITFGAPNGVYDLRVALGARYWTIKVQCADIVQAMDVMDSILGSHAENPTTRNNGQPLEPGDETWNSTDKQPYWWNGADWVALNSSAQQLEERLADPAKGAGMVGYRGRTQADKNRDMISLFDIIPRAEHEAIQQGQSDYDATDDLEEAFNEARSVLGVSGTINVSRKIVVPTLKRHGLFALPGDFLWINNTGSDFALEKDGRASSGISGQNALILSNVGFRSPSAASQAGGVYLHHMSHLLWSNVRFQAMGKHALKLEQVWNGEFNGVKMSSCGMVDGQPCLEFLNTDDDGCTALRFFGLTIEGSASAGGPRIKSTKAGTFPLAANHVNFFGARIASADTAVANPDLPVIDLESAKDWAFVGGHIVNGNSANHAAVRLRNGSDRNKFRSLSVACESKYAFELDASRENEIDVNVSSTFGTVANTQAWINLTNALTRDNDIMLRRNRGNSGEMAVPLSISPITATNSTGPNTVASNGIKRVGMASASITEYVLGTGATGAIRTRVTDSGMVFERRTSVGETDEQSVWQEVFRVRNNDRGIMFNGSCSHFYGDTPVGSREGSRGDIVWNQFPSTGEPVGWMAITTGTPADWQPFGVLGAK